jgi:hypothetical protein
MGLCGFDARAVQLGFGGEPQLRLFELRLEHRLPSDLLGIAAEITKHLVLFDKIAARDEQLLQPIG